MANGQIAPNPPAIIYGGVDGTGVSDNAEYAQYFENSYVHQLWKSIDANGGAKGYTRGPTTLGTEVNSEARGITQFIEKAIGRTGSNYKVVLAGYSRGGAAVIVAAQMLRDKKIDVGCMILFDAVSRALGIDASAIPSNVKRVYHLMRDSSTSSRTSFGNCGLEFNSKTTQYSVAKVYGTHGSIGGTPWWNSAMNDGKSKNTDTINEGMGWFGKTNVSYQQDMDATRKVGRHLLWILQQEGISLIGGTLNDPVNLPKPA